MYDIIEFVDPRPDITAALLYVFLDLAGYKLCQYYRHQFWKIMHLINSEYIVRIDQVKLKEYYVHTSTYLTK